MDEEGLACCTGEHLRLMERDVRFTLGPANAVLTRSLLSEY